MIELIEFHTLTITQWILKDIRNLKCDDATKAEN